MKLVRFGRSGAEKPGLVDADGTLRDLSRVVKDITPAVLAPAALRKLRAVKTARLPIVSGTPRLGCPLAGIGKMVCIGLNYTDHAEEVGMALPKEPTVFIKAPSAICGPDDATIRPRGGTSSTTSGAGRGHRRDARNVDEGRRWRTWPPTASSTTSPSARSRWSTAAPPPRARAPTPSARSARGSSPPTRSATRRPSSCGPRSTASDGRTAIPPR